MRLVDCSVYFEYLFKRSRMEVITMENHQLRNKEKMRKLPGAVPFILCIFAVERFAANSIVALLVLYLNRKLNFDQSTSTAVMHSNESLVYFFTVLGAIVGDSWWGAFKTIAWMMVVYSMGLAMIAVGAIESLNLPTLPLCIIGLVTIAIGSGGVRPNLNSFGGSQYKLPEQTKELKFFFSIQYFLLKCGSLIACILAPILRGDIKCFGMDDCYPLAFGLPAIVMLFVFVIFMCGTPLYVRQLPSGNMLVKVFGCIFDAVSAKLKHKDKAQKSHWLDYSVEKHGEKLVTDTKIIMNILVIFLPLPIYWSGSMLQNSRWVFQAARMNGDIGWFVIKPDQMIASNLLLSLLLFPVCEYFLYPFVARLGMHTLLHKMFFGGILGAIALALSSIVEWQIEDKFLNILWLLPQYFVFVLSENFIYIATLNFAYNEAPASMKSVMTSLVYVTIGLGNLFVAFIAGLQIFNLQFHECIFFTILVLVDMIIFGVLATRYKYVETNFNGGSCKAKSQI